MARHKPWVSLIFLSNFESSQSRFLAVYAPGVSILFQKLSSSTGLFEPQRYELAFNRLQVRCQNVLGSQINSLSRIITKSCTYTSPPIICTQLFSFHQDQQ